MSEEKKNQEPTTVPIEQYNNLLNQHNLAVSAFQKQEKEIKVLELSQKILEAYYAVCRHPMKRPQFKVSSTMKE